MIHEEITVQQTIPSDRFMLRPCRKSDAGLIAMYASDDRVARGTRSVPHPLPPGTVEAMIERALRSDRTEDGLDYRRVRPWPCRSLGADQP